MKTCTKCHVEKPLDEFYAWSRSRDGHSGTCKVCQNVATKTWAKAHPAEAKAIMDRYRAAHPEAIWVRNNVNLPIWRDNNRERVNELARNWARKHPEVGKEIGARRRARKAAVLINDLTEEQWLEIQEVFRHRCAYCGKRAKGHLTKDHITPLAGHGNHTVVNIVPACHSCNSKKNDGPPLCPVQPLLFTIAPPKKPKN